MWLRRLCVRLRASFASLRPFFPFPRNNQNYRICRHCDATPVVVLRLDDSAPTLPVALYCRFCIYAHYAFGSLKNEGIHVHHFRSHIALPARCNCLRAGISTFLVPLSSRGNGWGCGILITARHELCCCYCSQGSQRVGRRRRSSAQASQAAENCDDD